MSSDLTKILLFKYDGIGDMLFLRMFFDQLSEVLKSRHMQADFLCCERYRDLLTSEEKRGIGTFHFKRAGNFLRGSEKLKAQILSFIPRYSRKIAAHEQISPLMETKFDILMNINISSNVEIDLFNKLNASQRFMTKQSFDKTTSCLYDRSVSINHNAFILNLYKDILSEYFDTPFSIPSLSLPFTGEQSRQTAIEVLGEQEYICFAPFTSSHLRNWNIRNFASIAKALYKKTRLKIVILGNGKKASAWNDIKNDTNVINLINKTSLKQAIHIAAASKYAIVCDTALMHFALMGGSNCICISCGDSNKLFMEYPGEYNIKQTIVYPESFDSTVGVRHSNLDINLITPKMVLRKIDETWQLNEGVNSCFRQR